MKTYAGSCFCGAVQFSVTGEPAAMGYCHCASCRSWAAAPVNAFTLWKPDALKVTHGAEHIHSYSKTPTSLASPAASAAATSTPITRFGASSTFTRRAFPIFRTAPDCT